MTYLQFHFVFILPMMALLGWLYYRARHTEETPRSIKWLFAIAGIALVYTTAWDNYLVYRGVWGYGEDRVIGTIGYVPIEEYLFFLFQPILTGLFFYWRLATRKEASYAGPGNKSRWTGAIVYLALTVIGILHFKNDHGLYMGLILVWACPVLAAQWGYAGNWIWAERRLWFETTMIPTVYLWIADWTAIDLGIWYIAEQYTTGANLFGLPAEEATFFLVTNLLVIQGLFLFMHVGDPSRSLHSEPGKASLRRDR